MQKRNSSSFDFTTTGILVCPDLEVVMEGRSIKIVDDDIALTNVSIPPLVLRLVKGARIMFSCVVGFSSTRRSIDPESSGTGVLILLLLGELEGIYRSVNLQE